MQYSDIISGIGVSLILLAFFLLTFKLVKEHSPFYFVLNIIGGSFALYGSILIHSMPFAILEGTWTLVAIIGLLKKYIWIKKPS